MRRATRKRNTRDKVLESVTTSGLELVVVVAVGLVVAMVVAVVVVVVSSNVHFNGAQCICRQCTMIAAVHYARIC